jgi:hypothetical protein
MICLAFVLYPVEDNMLDDFLESIRLQTYCDFDLFTIVEPQFNGINRVKELSNNIVEIKGLNGASPVDNRNYLVEKLGQSNYDYAIFADIDDILSPDRVENSLERLKQGYNVVFNDLIKFHHRNNLGNTPLWGSRLNNLKLPNYKFNVLGLGNTAINVGILEGFNRPINTQIFDWSFFLNLDLLVKLNISKVEGYTYYRVHPNGLLNNFNEQSRLYGLNMEVMLDVIDNSEKSREINNLKRQHNNNNLEYVKDGFWFEKA